MKQFTSELPYSTNVRQSIYVRSNTGSNQTFALKQFWNDPITLTATTQWQRFDVVSTEYFNDGGVLIEGTNLDLHIFGAQLNTGTSPSTYQETTTRFNVTEAGVVSKSYLFFDGVDDGMATAAINFTATDKMTVFAGARKLSDVNEFGPICELSSDVFFNDGSFAIGQRAQSPDFGWAALIKGTQASGYWLNTYPAPATAVISVSYDISGATVSNEVKPRVNGAIPSLNIFNAENAGTGNFRNGVLYIGRRGGFSAIFVGNIYSIIVRGAATDDTTIASAETWVNSKTGAY
jgi:hypothetical protein